jgi:phosphate/sulfate permease
LPYLYNPESANLGPKVCYIYAGGALIGTVFVWAYIPETLGRSLEDINMVRSPFFSIQLGRAACVQGFRPVLRDSCRSINR